MTFQDLPRLLLNLSIFALAFAGPQVASVSADYHRYYSYPFLRHSPSFLQIRGGSSSSHQDHKDDDTVDQQRYGRLSDDYFRLTPEQIETFHRDGCVTILDVLTEEEVDELRQIFDRFVSGVIHVPGKDFCDMSKPYGIPYEQWSIVNCMLPTRYYPPLKGNIYERLTSSIAQQLFPNSEGGKMIKDYDQLLNKRPGKSDASFAWHQVRETVYLFSCLSWSCNPTIGLTVSNKRELTAPLRTWLIGQDQQPWALIAPILVPSA